MRGRQPKAAPATAAVLPWTEPEIAPLDIVGHPEIGIVLAVILLIALVVLPVARLVQKRRLQPLEPIFEPGTFRLAGFVPVWAEGRIEGYHCRYRIVDRSKNSPGGARLEIGVVAPFPWEAARTNAVSRTLSSLGMMRDFEIGDSQLDEELRFAAAYPDVLGALFRIDTAREALRRLVAGDAFAGIAARHGELRVRWQPRRRGVDEDPEAVRRRISETIGVATALSYPPGH